MKTIPVAMDTHLLGDVTTLAWCWKATRRDGQVFGFTTHDINLNIDNVIYYAETGLNATNAQAKVGTSVDNLEVAGMLDSSTITEQDLRSGLWDMCNIEVFIVNWKDVTQKLIIQAGTLGDVTIKKQQFISEMRSLSQFLQNTIGRIMTKRCDASFGDSRCGMNLATHTRTSSVSGVTDYVTINTTDDLNSAPQIIANGKLTWTSGLNKGGSIEVKSIGTSTLGLVLPMANDVSIGDTFIVSSGCDKNFNSTTGCSFYNNRINFRGYPFIPGIDKIMDYPDAK